MNSIMNLIASYYESFELPSDRLLSSLKEEPLRIIYNHIKSGNKLYSKKKRKNVGREAMIKFIRNFHKLRKNNFKEYYNSNSSKDLKDSDIINKLSYMTDVSNASFFRTQIMIIEGPTRSGKVRFYLNNYLSIF